MQFILQFAQLLNLLFKFVGWVFSRVLFPFFRFFYRHATQQNQPPKSRQRPPLRP